MNQKTLLIEAEPEAAALRGRGWVVYVGDVLDSLRRLPDCSVHCVVTSPPYYGLRDYGTAEWEGGDAECDHLGRSQTSGASTLNQWKDGGGQQYKEETGGMPFREVCGKCGARRIDQQIGLEKTPAEFIAKLVEVFEEVRRVLRDDGTCWVNMGDSYTSGGRSTFRSGASENKGHEIQNGLQRPAMPENLKPKDLMGMPWRLAFALQDAGWYLRQDIVWHKKSPMPESVTDRCTKAHEYIFKFSKGDEYFQAGLIQDHEYVFLLAKQQRYFYDAEAIREPGCRADWSVQKFKGGDLTTHHKSSTAAEALDPTAGRNCRSVWTLSTEPLRQKHFAAFPSSLPARCIKAGTSEKGCCAQCGAPWVRIVETERVATRPGTASKLLRDGMAIERETNELVDCLNKPWAANGIEVGNRDPLRHVSVKTTSGWQPSCNCHADIVPCTVLDPFSGSGTSGLAANELGRSYIGCELNPEYAEMSASRIESWKTRDAEKTADPLDGQKELF